MKYRSRTLIVLMLLVLSSLSCRFLQSVVTQTMATGTPPVRNENPQQSTSAAAPTAVTEIEPVIAAREYRDENPPRYGISINYPLLQGPDGPQAGNFNDLAQQQVDTLIAEFQNGLAMDPIITPDANAPTPQNFLTSDFEVLYNDHGVVSIHAENSQYFYGAAHPLPFSSVINYSLPLQRELVLADLFQPSTQYLQIIADYCTNQLKNDEWFMFSEGALPEEQNYQKWNITPEGLRITYDPYQVAAYAAGYIRVTVPWEELRGIIAEDGPVGVLVN